jgi:hypothetical protein
VVLVRGVGAAALELLVHGCPSEEFLDHGDGGRTLELELEKRLLGAEMRSGSWRSRASKGEVWWLSGALWIRSWRFEVGQWHWGWGCL